MNHDIENLDFSRYKALKLGLDDQGILTVTISNPGRKNAITGEASAELCFIFHEAWADENVKVIILTGEGGDFCSGADVGKKKEEATPEPGAKRQFPDFIQQERHGKAHFYTMLQCDKPIISKVRGVAYGLGVNLAIGGDIIFATEDARFCDSHVRVGITPGDGGTTLWPQLIGFHKAKELIMLGDEISGKQAHELGLINYVVPDDELDARVQEMAERLANGPQAAIRWAKASVNTMMLQTMSGAFNTSMALDHLSMNTSDHIEAVTAFSEKRKPDFTGS